MSQMFLFIIGYLICSVKGFVPHMSIKIMRTSVGSMSGLHSTFQDMSQLLLADTSVSEEDLIAISGQTAELPSPLFAIAFAFIVFAGVAVLQFSLGDLTKEEGQARVRDFLQTKRDTERKRGYFD